MSADVDMLPRQWNKDLTGTKNHLDGSNGPSVSSIPAWKKNLLVKKKHQHKNGLMLDEANDIPEPCALKSVVQGDASTSSYFYPAIEDNCKSCISRDDSRLNSTSQESEKSEREEEEESILPVHQNPILLQDLERRSKELANQVSFKSFHWKNSAEEPAAFPAATEEDSVFGDSSKTEEDGNSDEVVYGRGFVHRLLLKFSSLAQQDEQQKAFHPHRTMPKGNAEGIYNSEPSLASKTQPRKKSNTSTKVTKQQKENEDKSFSDGEDKIEPVSNTLCMFEKLFCSRKKCQEYEEPEKALKMNGASHLKPAKKKFIQKASVPNALIFNDKHKMHHSPSDYDSSSHSTHPPSDFHSNISKKPASEICESSTSLANTQGEASNIKESDKISSPIDVKLVTSLFETASSLTKQSIKEIKAISERCPTQVTDRNDSQDLTTIAPSMTSVSDSFLVAPKKVEGDQQLRQHKRHSSKDYLEIKQSDKISKEYTVAVESSHQKDTIQNPPGSLKTSAKHAATIARPGKLLFRSSGSSADVSSLPKYNDIKTGEFVPASKVCIEDLTDDRDEDDFNFEFEGAGVCLEKSMLAKTRNNKKMKITFDDDSTSVYEYPSEQCLLDWFNEHATANVIRDAMFFI